MINWQYDRLDEMTKQGSTLNNIKLNYRVIADNFEEIVITARNNGELVPIEFEDVKSGCDGDPLSEIKLSDISPEIAENIQDKLRQRKLMEVKHISRGISHTEWFNYLDQEVIDFVNKFPQFKDVIIEDNE